MHEQSETGAEDTGRLFRSITGVQNEADFKQLAQQRGAERGGVSRKEHKRGKNLEQKGRTMTDSSAT